MTAPAPRPHEARVELSEELVESACEVMHDAYEAAAIGTGWETQERSRKPWSDVPEANKATMRVAVRALLTSPVHAQILAARLAPIEALAPRLCTCRPGTEHWAMCPGKRLDNLLRADHATPDAASGGEER